MAFKNGTGLVRFSYDLYEERVSIDLSGEGDDQCYRNDASVFFFCSNSYRTAYRTIERELKEDFSNRRDIKRILHLLLPYVFTFRQYYELELKALITSVSDEYPKTTHRVDALIDKLYVSAMDFKSRVIVFDLLTSYIGGDVSIESQWLTDPCRWYHHHLHQGNPEHDSGISKTAAQAAGYMAIYLGIVAV